MSLMCLSSLFNYNPSALKAVSSPRGLTGIIAFWGGGGGGGGGAV